MKVADISDHSLREMSVGKLSSEKRLQTSRYLIIFQEVKIFCGCDPYDKQERINCRCGDGWQIKSAICVHNEPLPNVIKNFIKYSLTFTDKGRTDEDYLARELTRLFDEV